MQITSENKCTSAARANNFLDKFSTPQLSKMILNTNGTHGYYQRILGQYLSPYPYDALLGFHWVPNGWKLEPVESTPTNVSFEQLFLDKVKPIQEKQKKNQMKLDLNTSLGRKSKYIAVCATSSPGHLVFLILEDKIFPSIRY